MKVNQNEKQLIQKRYKRAKFAAFGIRLDAEPMTRRTPASRRGRHPCIPDLTSTYPERDATCSSSKDVEGEVQAGCGARTRETDPNVRNGVEQPNGSRRVP